MIEIPAKTFFPMSQIVSRQLPFLCENEFCKRKRKRREISWEKICVHFAKKMRNFPSKKENSLNFFSTIECKINSWKGKQYSTHMDYEAKRDSTANKISGSSL